MAKGERAESPLDVLIVGTGIAGISAGVHLKRHSPGTTFAMLERRAAIGGTWDLFRYPGVRSDSDMYTLGFGFRPWTGDDAIARGEDIRDYLAATVRDEGLLSHIRFGHDLLSADWSDAESLWHARVVTGTGEQVIAARLLHLCCGYYDYAAGYQPDFAGMDDFTGTIVHPQHWPDGLDVSGKHVVVIGSGATAVTLVPELAARGAQVTMVQRSPSYMIARPQRDRIAHAAQRLLGAQRGYAMIRARNAALQRFVFNHARKRPAKMAKWLLGKVARAMPGTDIARDMTPRYGPWEQRLCLVPDGDFFAAVNSGQARIATGAIGHMVLDGLEMADGQHVPADIIVTATGLNLQLFGGAAISVNGRVVKPSEHVLYKGLMLDAVPNLLFTFGYTNASWTLKADMVAQYLVRLVAAMRDVRATVAVAGPVPAGIKRTRMVDFSSGYFIRSRQLWPKQGDSGPWTLPQDYRVDRQRLLQDPVTDGTLQLS